MTSPLVDVLNSLQAGIRELNLVHDNLLERIKTLEEEKRILKLEIKEKDTALAKANADLEYLKVSYKLADNPATLVEARQKIARLIRTIDNCISTLKDE